MHKSFKLWLKLVLVITIVITTQTSCDSGADDPDEQVIQGGDDDDVGTGGDDGDQGMTDPVVMYVDKIVRTINNMSFEFDYQYNSDKNLVRIDDPYGYREFNYNGDNIESEINVSSVGNDRVVEYFYDSENRLDYYSVVDVPSGSIIYYNLDYDDLGRIERYSVHQTLEDLMANTNWSNENFFYYQSDTSRTIEEIVVNQSNDGCILRLSYEYDDGRVMYFGEAIERIKFVVRFIQGGFDIAISDLPTSKLSSLDCETGVNEYVYKKYMNIFDDDGFLVELSEQQFDAAGNIIESAERVIEHTSL